MSDFDARVQQLADETAREVHLRTDRMFAGLLTFQWLAGIVLALWLTPRQWSGAESTVHPHLWAAMVLGGLIVTWPLVLIATRPGHLLTRHVIAVAQMLASALLIHLTGGRIETHFHVFGSLTFLSFYRDWRVLLTGTVVVAAEHFLRGVYWPQSIYGTATGSDWRWLEHVGWVGFLDVFLFYSIGQSCRGMRDAAEREVRLQEARSNVEQKVADRTRELEEVQKELASAFNDSAIGMSLVAPEGRFLKVNPALSQILGYSQDELLGMTFQDVTHPEDLDPDLSQVRQVLDGVATGFELEKRYVHKDGHVVWALLSVALVRDRDGQPVHFVSQIQDVSQRKQAEADQRRDSQALAELSRMHQAILDHSAYAIITTSMDGVIQLFNPAAERMLGYAAAEAVGQLSLHVFHLEDELKAAAAELTRELGETVQPSLAVFAARARLGLPNKSEWTLVRKDGTQFPASMSCTVLYDANGQPSGMLSICGDITARREAEARLCHTLEHLEEARSQAESANRAKSEFLANMSHEIRTPMNGVIGLTELLLDTRLDPHQRQSLEMVKSSGESLMKVINDILDFSKIEAGRLDLDPIEFSLSELLSDTLKPLALRGHGKGLELACDIGPGVPDWIVGDPGRLKQVLINLVGNALKFTERGEVVVRVALISKSDEESKLRFAVTDTGIGITEEARQRIFSPFSQADGSTTRRYGGTGLGLTISDRLVALMGGQLQVDSTVGLGSTFHFEATFPAAKNPAPPPATPHVSTLLGVPILIVDDNATNRAILEQLLRDRGAKPVCVDGGSAALAELRRAAALGQQYSVLLVDAMMPDMDGFMLVEQLRREPSLAPSAIMMLTSADQQGDGARCRELGMASYLLKPIRASELVHTILTALDRESEQAASRAATAEKERAVSGRSLSILLAEDNAINQRVAVSLLEKMGHKVTVTVDGHEALCTWQRESFDLVLMDVQMPVMDGFDATREIRIREARQGGRHVPIVAMTAHAMKGDRERCLAAGMDDYLSKPIQTSELKRVLQPLMDQPEPDVPATTTEGSEPRSFDRHAALNRLGGDESLLNEVAALFLEQTPTRLEEVRQAVAIGDVDRLRKAAHSLKGSLGYLDAGAAYASALKLEALAHEGNVHEATQTLEDLLKDVDRVLEDVTHLVFQAR